MTVPPHRDRSRAVIQAASRSDLSRTVMVASLAPADLGDNGKMVGVGVRREPRQHQMTAHQHTIDGQAQRPGRKDGQLGLPAGYIIKPGLGTEGALDGFTARC